MIEQTMNEIVIHDPTIESDDSEFEIGMDEVEFDQSDVIFKSSDNVINIDANMSEMKDFPYSSSD